MPTTIKTALSEAFRSLNTVSDSALLDSEILLCLAMGAQRSHLRAWPEKTIPSEQHRHFLSLLKQRQQGVPVAYITGVREFWSREFEVTPDVLIPRPDTELLIEISLKLLPRDKPSTLIDLGTGSGIIAITLAAECPLAKVFASDKSPAALAVAQRNAKKHQLGNIQFYLSDWFAKIPDIQFSLVVSNPPYIAESDQHLQQGDVRFEPTSALCAPDMGLGDIKIIADLARKSIEPGGHLLIEHGYNQQTQVKAIFEAMDYINIHTYNDFSGQPRATCGQKAVP